MLGHGKFAVEAGIDHDASEGNQAVSQRQDVYPDPRSERWRDPRPVQEVKTDLNAYSILDEALSGPGAFRRERDCNVAVVDGSLGRRLWRINNGRSRGSDQGRCSALALGHDGH